MSGLISRAFLAGSADPQRYYKKYPRSTWIPKGGYEIQTTPDELAAAISHIRPYLKGHRMLCLGAETLGAERFLAENLGVLEIDLDTIPPENKNQRALNGIRVNVKRPEGRYDVVTVFGSANIDNILDHVKIGSFIVFIGTTVKENPELRSKWMATRKAHMAQLQTGGLPYETGIGVAKVLFCNPDKEVHVAKAENSGEANGNSSPDAGPGNGEVLGGVAGSVSDIGADSKVVSAPVKRRGRPPRKVEA